MDVVLDSIEVLCKDVHFVGLDSALLTFMFTCIHDILHILILVDVGDITGIQYGVHILQHLLVDDLRVNKQERDSLVLHTSYHEDFFDVLSP